MKAKTLLPLLAALILVPFTTIIAVLYAGTSTPIGTFRVIEKNHGHATNTATLENEVLPRQSADTIIEAGNITDLTEGGKVRINNFG
jgi:hypothetical protein